MFDACGCGPGFPLNSKPCATLLRNSLCIATIETFASLSISDPL